MILSGKKKLIFSVGAFVLITVSIGYYYWENKKMQFNSLWDILDYYDFNSLDQKKSLEFLMKKAEIIKSTETFITLFPKRDNINSLFKDILNFVELTQKYFTIRSGTQERWEVQPTKWMKENQPPVLNALTSLGFTETVMPNYPRPDVVCVLGARKDTMLSRLEYLGELFNKNDLKAKYLILLAGERKATVDIDGSEQELLKIAKSYQMKIADLTETHLMQEAYNTSAIFDKLPTEIINTPRGDLPRPTTETTVREFCKWLKAHSDVHTVTFVSNQPHVKYQEAVIEEVFKQQEVAVKFEVIGPKIEPDVEIQELVGALGSQIWAKTPSVIVKTKLIPTDKNLSKAFINLYIRQPLIYKNVESLLYE